MNEKKTLEMKVVELEERIDAQAAAAVPCFHRGARGRAEDTAHERQIKRSMIMHYKSVLAGAAIALAAGFGSASAADQFSTLDGILAHPMTTLEMGVVVGASVLTVSPASGDLSAPPTNQFIGTIVVLGGLGFFIPHPAGFTTSSTLTTITSSSGETDGKTLQATIRFDPPICGGCLL